MFVSDPKSTMLLPCFCNFGRGGCFFEDLEALTDLTLAFFFVDSVDSVFKAFEGPLDLDLPPSLSPCRAAISPILSRALSISLSLSLAHSSAAHQLRSSSEAKIAQFFSEADEPLKARNAAMARCVALR